eukprot:366000-Chlamydomonas_euryale.AAC.63
MRLGRALNGQVGREKAGLEPVHDVHLGEGPLQDALRVLVHPLVVRKRLWADNWAAHLRHALSPGSRASWERTAGGTGSASPIAWRTPVRTAGEYRREGGWPATAPTPLPPPASAAPVRSLAMRPAMLGGCQRSPGLAGGAPGAPGAAALSPRPRPAVKPRPRPARSTGSGGGMPAAYVNGDRASARWPDSGLHARA